MHKHAGRGRSASWSAPARSFLDWTFTETPGSKKREGRPTLIHPEDAARHWAGRGRLAEIGNDRGRGFLHVKPFDGRLARAAGDLSIWPNAAFVGGNGIDTATASDDAGLPNGGAVFHDTAVWIGKAAESRA